VGNRTVQRNTTELGEDCFWFEKSGSKYELEKRQHGNDRVGPQEEESKIRISRHWVQSPALIFDGIDGVEGAFEWVVTSPVAGCALYAVELFFQNPECLYRTVMASGEFLCDLLFAFCSSDPCPLELALNIWDSCSDITIDDRERFLEF